jgi:hypothetical protein
MDRKQMCVANVQYKKPSNDGTKQAKSLLKYLTYRESREEKAKHVAGRERWIDHAMGGSVAEIARQCEALHSDHVLLFSLVMNPNPDLMAMVEPEDRERFVKELTEQVVEDFFEARGLDTGIEFSYVLHHRDSTDPQAPGRHDPHTHAVLPGTVYDEEHGGRVPLFFSQNRKVNHIEMLHEVTEDAMAALMDRYVGPEWEHAYDLTQGLRDLQREIVVDTPHGEMVDEDGSHWPMWCGARCTNETHSAVGYYRSYSTPTREDDEATRFEFRPLISGLSHEEAKFFGELFAAWIQRDLGTLQEFVAEVSAMSPDERAAFMAKSIKVDEPSPDRSPDFDL